MSIKLKKQSAGSVSTPRDTHVQLYVGMDGLPRIKDSEGSDTELSQSGVLTLVEQGTSPSPEADKFKIYSKDVAGLTELFFLDNAGQEIQVTDDGSLLTGAAVALATTGSPVTVSGSGQPSTGQVLTAVSGSAAEWMDASGGGLTQDPTLHHVGFAATVNTAYLIWTSDGVNKTVLLPASPNEGDMIEISALGGGNDNITVNGNGNDVTWGGFQFGIAFTFKGAGFHALLRWTDEAAGSWTNITDDVTSRFGNSGSPAGNSVIFTESSGRVNTLLVGPNTMVGRVGSQGISPVMNHTKVLDTNFTITQTAPDYVSTFQWTPTEIGVNYCFEFHLAVTQATAPGVVGFGVFYDDFTGPVVFNATLVRASNVATNATVVTTAIATVDDSSARSVGGPFETTITGSFRSDTIATLSLQGKRSAGTTTVLRGSWGRVWKAETI